MASYTSLVFLLLFLPCAIIGYNILPQRKRWIALLFFSYAFFGIISGKLLVFLLVSTISIHYIGLWLTVLRTDRDNLLVDKEKDERKKIKANYQKKMRGILVLAILFNVGMLIVLKYTPFFGSNLNTLLRMLHISFQITVPKFIMPIGISFYTLQAVSYMLDVYRGTIDADKNLARVALFMSFFPQIMEGPICRYSETAMQLWKGERTTYHNLTFGLQRILFGMLKKIVVADRLNMFIENVFTNYAKYDGGVVFIAMLCYTCQLYMDFSGTMDVVMGVGEIFGIKMPENFRQPFFSKSISEFWTRWHITLGTWFRDYIFYPLSMSKPLKKITTSARKKLGNHFGPLIAGSIALFVVWLCNGLWHGAGWHYIFFGMYHFILIITANICEPFIVKLTKKLHINRDCLPYKIFRILKTTLLVCIGELFFRAHGLVAGLIMFKNMVTSFTFSSVKNGSFFLLGMDKKDFIIVIVTVIMILVVSILKEKGINIREKISKKHVVVRWAFYYAIILFIIIFGAYGSGYVPVDPIYAGF